MVRYQARLEKKQAFLFRAVDVAMEILVMCAVVSRTQKLVDQGRPEAKDALQMADLHCLNARRAIEKSFTDLWANDDDAKYRVGQRVLDGTHAWLEADAPVVTVPGRNDDQAETA